MMKKIMAVLATVAAVLGFGFATSTAMADDYGQTGTVTSSSVAVTLNGFTEGEDVVVTSDKGTSIEQVAQLTVKAKTGGVVNVKVNGVPCNTTVTVKGVGQTSGHVATATATTAACNADGSAATTANTGASVAPYAVAVVLLAAAGIALFAVRKTSAR
ncbi:hypothetical protein [Bifidobacterium platyrrhinorum]|uniref:Sortase n=1 Tax=Bifidobacterium platyrrhinorum TaxID=2661628 RepID=A0A6L9SRN3_9BIFI|nr:hypothetical protein [Bifidobacterium platyrrhinorum]NEG55154.1 hypothetical protein [Bifidobacterium platyrrhinorum]